MNSLADLLSYVVTTLQSSQLVRNVNVLETLQFSDDKFALKARADLASGDVLQVRLYQNVQHTDYAYQLFRDEFSVVRWDNKEHFSSLSSYPHHFHTASDQAESSPLTGDPAHDLPLVLKYLESR